MKKYVLLNLWMALMILPAMAKDVTQPINNICSFTFPAAPQVTEAQGAKNYLYNTDSCSYLVQAKRVTEQGIVKDTATLYSFYRGIIKGILRASHGSVVSIKKIENGNLHEVELEYVKGDKDHLPLSVCSRILLVDDYLVITSFSAPFERFMGQKVLKENFFNSFSLIKINAPSQVLAKDTANVPVEASDTVRIPTPIFDSVTSKLHAGPVRTELVKNNTLHFIISFALAILLLAGGLYILVRWRKNRNQS